MEQQRTDGHLQPITGFLGDCALNYEPHLLVRMNIRPHGLILDDTKVPLFSLHPRQVTCGPLEGTTEARGFDGFEHVRRSQPWGECELDAQRTRCELDQRSSSRRSRSRSNSGSAGSEPNHENITQKGMEVRIIRYGVSDVRQWEAARRFLRFQHRENVNPRDGPRGVVCPIW